MVATHSRPRQPSAGGSMGHSSSKSKRRASLRRQTEKLPSSVVSPTLSSSNSNTISSTRNINNHQRRSKSISAASPQNVHQQQNIRRPSAPASALEAPRLSIADKFMASDFSDNTPKPPLPSFQQSTSPTLSNTSQSLVLSNSMISDMPTTGSNSRLSVADRFMNQGIAQAGLSRSTSVLSTSGVQQYRERSTSIFSGKTLNNKPSSSTLYPTSEPTLGRLTIADTFMKSSAATLSPSMSNNTRSRAASFGELDMSVINSNIRDSKPKPPPGHPHDLQQPSKTNLFDDTQYLNLDFNLSSPSTSSSVLNGRQSRPWGSQDTLVHYNQPEKKKPIYAQFIEAEKNTTISDNRTFSFGDYFLDSPDNDKRTITMSDGVSTKHGYDEYDDIEIGYDKHDKYQKYYSYSNRDWEYEDQHAHKDDVKSYQYEDQNAPTSATAAAAAAKLKKSQEASVYIPDEYDSRGFWVGCCFVSCGQKPSRSTIERQKQRREKEIEQDMKPKNRGFGRRGWVFCTFLSLLIVVLVTYFLWPRTPLMRIEGASLTSPAKITETRQGPMMGNFAFESEWLVNITVDNRQNHVPTRLVQVQVLAKDALTGLVIGKGLHNDDSNPEHIVLAPNTISTIQIPIRVDYQARDSTDTTFVDLTKACSPQHMIPFNTPDGGMSPANQRESLPLHFWITLHFFGLDWLGYKPTVIATPATGGFACPQT